MGETMSEERKANLKFGVDGSAVKPGLEQIESDVEGMSQKVSGSGKKASDGIELIGKSAPKVTQALETESRKWVQSVQRATAATDAGAKSGADYLEKLGSGRGLSADFMKPYITGLRQAEEAQKAASAGMGRMEISAKQTAAALRGVPAQLTDIVVSLQGGMNPITVFLQQGGQLKDMFGGAGNAAKALGGYVLGLVSPLTIAAAAVAAVGAGMAVVESESRKLSDINIAFKAVGREALLTGDDIKSLRREMSLLPQMSKDAAGAVITEFARTREIGAGMLKGLSLGINDFAVALGQDVPAAAKTLAKAFADPAKGAKELDDALGFLTSNQLLAINAMVEAGDKAGAQKVMLEALTEATKGLAKEGTELEKATRGFGRQWTEAMGNIGDSAALRRANEVLAGIITTAGEATLALSKMKMPDWMLLLPGGAGSGLKLATTALGAAYPSKDAAAAAAAPASRPVEWNGGKGMPALTMGDVGLPPVTMYGTAAKPGAVRIDYTPKPAAGAPLGSPTAAPVQTAKQLDEQVKSILEANKGYKSQKSVVEDIRKDIDRTSAALKAVVVDDKTSGKNTSERAEKLQEILDGQNEKLKAALKKQAGSGAAAPGESEVAGIRAGTAQQRLYLAALKESGAEALKQTEGQKQVAKITEELKTSISGAARASKEKALAAAEDRAEVDKDVVAEERRIAGLERSKQAYASVVDEARKTADAINQQADELEAANSMWGKGRVAVEQYRLALIQARLAEIDNTSEGSYDPAYVAGLRAQEAAQTRKVDQSRIADGKVLNEQADELLRSAEAMAGQYREEAALTGKTTLERAKVVAQRQVELKYAQKIAEVDKSSATDEQKVAAKDKLRQAERVEGEAAVAKVVEEDWAKTSDQINQSLTDALLRGFESGKGFAENLKDTVVNMFKTMILRPVISGVIGQVTGGVSSLLGGGGAGGAAGGSPLGSLLSLGSTAYQGYTGLTSGQGVLGAIGNYVGLGSGASSLAAAQAANVAVANGLTPLVATNVGSAGAVANGVVGASGYTATGGAAGAGMGAFATGGIVAAIMLAFINAFGGMRTETQIGSGLAGTLGNGTSLTPWQEWREGGTLFDGPSFATHNPLEELSTRRSELQRLRDSGLGETNYAVSIQAVVTDLEKTTKGLAEQTEVFNREIGKGYKTFRSNVVDMADSLGLAGDSIKDFAYTLGAQDLNFQGLNPEQIQAKITETFGKAGTEMAQQLLGSFKEVTDTVVNTYVTEQQTQAADGSFQTDTTVTKRMEYQASVYAKVGETALDTLTRLATSFGTLNNTADALGFGLQKGSLALADFSDKFIEAFGGLERFTASTGAFLQNYYSDEERRQALLRSGARQAESLGIEGVTAESLEQLGRDGIRAFVNSLSASPDAYADAIDLANFLSPAFEALDAQVPVVQEVTAVVDELTQAYQNAIKSLKSEADSLAVESLRAQGKGKEADALERQQFLAQFAGLDEVRLQEIATKYDANKATKAYIQGIKDAAQAQVDALTKLRNEARDSIDTAAGKTDAAMAAAERSVDKERERLQANIDAIKSVFDAAKSGAKSFFAEVESAAKFQGQQGRDFITEALAKVQAGGALPDGEELADAIDAVSKDLGATQFASQADADFQRLVVANELKGLQESSGDQLTTAEDQLKTLNDQLEWARVQVDALRGIDSKLKDLPTAIANLILAYNEEDQTRANVASKGILSKSGAYFDYASGTGLTSSGTHFDAEAIKQAAIDSGATGQQIYQAIKDAGFTLAEAEKMFGSAPGSLEEEARKMGLRVFHAGTPYVPETQFALLQKGEAVIPTAYNPFAGGKALGGVQEVMQVLQVVREERGQMREQFAQFLAQLTRTADAVNGRPESPMLVENV